MRLYKEFGIPENFEEQLPELKTKTMKWETVCYSGTATNSKSTISFYKPIENKILGNLILVPGLATNSRVDPLMKSIQYWGLTHHYNIVNIDTFLNDFEQADNHEFIAKNTYPELKTILKQSIQFIRSHIDNNHTCIIGHCLSSTAITDVLNEFTKKRQPLPVQSAIFFAPWPIIPKSKFDTLKAYITKTESNPLPIDSATRLKIQQKKFVYAMQNVVHQIEDSKFEPSIVAQWGIPVSYIVAGRDKTAPADRAKAHIELLTKEQGSTKFDYLYLPERQHTFENLYQEAKNIISVIKTQRQIRTKQ